MSSTGKKPYKRESTAQVAKRLIEPVLQERGLFLWDVRFEKEGGSWYLRYFIDKPGGVNIGDCEFVSRAVEKLLDESYKKLISFECPLKGYEWFGGDPGHEALTAYGLMQFTEMRKVMPVDSAMLERTRAWLLDRRDGKGG